MWGPWAGREVDYYVECARRVTPLAWSDIRARIGAPIDAQVKAVDDALAALREERVPELAQVVLLEPLGVRGNRVRLRTYSEYDPLDLSVDVAKKIRLFDERPVSAAVELAQEEGVDLDRATLQALFDYGVLDES
jgi:hypothetical protein